MTTTVPDIFTNVHKGIRKALCEACLALGRAGADAERAAAARALLESALRFVTHHGDNEDQLLVPLLEARAPELAARMLQGHERIHSALRALASSVASASTLELYKHTCRFIGLYFEHMAEEENELELAIRAALGPEELTAFGRRAVERTAPADQRMMLTWMLPAMTRVDVEEFLGRLPPALADELRPLGG